LFFVLRVLIGGGHVDVNDHLSTQVLARVAA
jgi:hypothetical protein